MLVRFTNAEQLATLHPESPVSPLDWSLWVRHAPDEHWGWVEGDRLLARCSLWWQSVPPYPQQRLGIIGHYAAQSPDASTRLLQQACAQLAGQGCTMAIGPMDGNTWRAYRLVSDRHPLTTQPHPPEPPFFLEPNTPDAYCTYVKAAGFKPLAHYYSALNPDLRQRDDRHDRMQARLAAQGITIQPLDPTQFETTLQHIHALSLTSFRHNFLYTPIDQAEFIAQYLPIQPYLQPELVLLARHQGELVGFLFAVPDVLQAQRGQPIDTVIIKTVAVLPGRTYAGLGTYLVDQGQAIAQQLGYTRALHALMHETNTSRHISDRYAYPIRRYTLYVRQLGALD